MIVSHADKPEIYNKIFNNRKATILAAARLVSKLQEVNQKVLKSLDSEKQKLGERLISEKQKIEARIQILKNSKASEEDQKSLWNYLSVLENNYQMSCQKIYASIKLQEYITGQISVCKKQVYDANIRKDDTFSHELCDYEDLNKLLKNSKVDSLIGEQIKALKTCRTYEIDYANKVSNHLWAEVGYTFICILGGLAIVGIVPAFFVLSFFVNPMFIIPLVILGLPALAGGFALISEGIESIFRTASCVLEGPDASYVDPIELTDIMSTTNSEAANNIPTVEARSVCHKSVDLTEKVSVSKSVSVSAVSQTLFAKPKDVEYPDLSELQREYEEENSSSFNNHL